jgi:hypothetical protein
MVIDMPSATNFARIILVVVIVPFWTAAFAPLAMAQDNAICVSQMGCTPGQSAAFIDASVLGSLNTDICAVLYGILSAKSYRPTGEVIDARGFPGTLGTTMTCAAGTTPWFESATGYANVPSTILLPAATITIPATWILPGGTKLIGEGSTATGVGATQIQACTTSLNGCSANLVGPMLQFGAPLCPGNECTGIVTGISVEDVLLNGNGLGVMGIQNGWSQELTYVDHVSLYQILGTGLQVNGNATNSGPYTNITFDTGGFAGTTGTVCAQITTVSGTRGIHGLSCTSRPSGSLILTRKALSSSTPCRFIPAH